MVVMKNEKTGMAVTVVEAAAGRWVVELVDIDCDPPQLVNGWREYKTESEALKYAEKCMKG
jgi:hypothetical protein